jgi:methylmalonyl-CoA/ethylmalonyl-CoA epimerase
VTADRDVAALLARVSGGLFQQAWVVDDLPAAEDAMRKTLGCGEFTKFRMDEPWTLRGEPVSCPLDLGFARSGNMQIELMQPLGNVGVQAEFLAERGAGPHHFGVLVADLDASLAAAAEDGFPAVMHGQFAAVRLAFVDTLETLGIYIELIEDPQGLLWATAPWRDDRPDWTQRRIQ